MNENFTESAEARAQARAKSRRWKIIKAFTVMAFILILYVGIAIPILKEKFTPFMLFFTTTTGALISAIGVWIGFISAKQKD